MLKIVNNQKEKRVGSFLLTLVLVFTFSKASFATCASSVMSVEIHLTEPTFKEAQTKSFKAIKFKQGDYVLLLGRRISGFGIMQDREEKKVYLTEGYYLDYNNGDIEVKASGLIYNPYGNQPIEISLVYDHEVSSKEGLTGFVKYSTTLMGIENKLVHDGIIRPREYNLAYLGSCHITDLFPSIESYWWNL